MFHHGTTLALASIFALKSTENHGSKTVDKAVFISPYKKNSDFLSKRLSLYNNRFFFWFRSSCIFRCRIWIVSFRRWRSWNFSVDSSRDYFCISNTKSCIDPSSLILSEIAFLCEICYSLVPFLTRNVISSTINSLKILLSLSPFQTWFPYKQFRDGCSDICITEYINLLILSHNTVAKKW